MTRERVWGLGFLVASGVYLIGALGFPVGSVAKPGPGFFPVGVGVFLCLAAAALTLAVGRGLQGPQSQRITRAEAGLSHDARLRVVTTMLALVGFSLVLPWVGYPASAFAFVALLLRRLGNAAWPGALVTASLGALVSYYAFGVLLGVPLPRGSF
jgi:putative tricarboxylic transport membrane protein